jgi:hypothetical protein
MIFLGKQYSLKYPTYGMSLYRTGRKLRVSALHPKLQAAGAVFGEVLGYERPLFFNLDEFEKSISKKQFFLFFISFEFFSKEKIPKILVNKVHLVKLVGLISLNVNIMHVEKVWRLLI